MAETTAEFRALMTRVRQGCPDAARQLHDHYSPALYRVVRKFLFRQMRTRFDSVDFVQQVWQSFFAGDMNGPGLDDPDALIRYLTQMAKNKVKDEGRRQQTAKRNLSRSVAVSLHGSKDFPAAQPTPSQEVIAGEQFEQLTAGQPEHVRRILVMLRQGYSRAAIADAVGISEKFIQRILQRLSERRGPP